MGNFNYQEIKTPANPYKVYQRTQFNELVVGAGTGQIKQVKTGVKFQDKHYFIKGTTSLPILQLDQDSNLNFSADGTGKGQLIWPSGRFLVCDAASGTFSGNWLVLGGVRATSYTARVGSTDYAGVDLIQESSVDTFSIEIRKGLIINFNKNS